MAKRARRAGRTANPERESIESEPLEPIRVVERELTRPDGSTVRVRVPVYPPFRLKSRPPRKRASGE